MLILSVVYIGAIIILIGYVCAVCPNVMVVTPFRSFFFPFALFSFLSLFFSPSFFVNSSPSFISLIDFFYSSEGILIFLSILIMLFLCLLMVTSQYLTPKGPFRSII